MSCNSADHTSEYQIMERVKQIPVGKSGQPDWIENSGLANRGSTVGRLDLEL